MSKNFSSAAARFGAAGLLLALCVGAPARAQEPALASAPTVAPEPAVVSPGTVVPAGAEAPSATGVPAPSVAPEQADWRVEFEAVCAGTDASQSLSREELMERIARCDRLAEKIGAEEATVRKVYLRRLKMCRDLYAFVLESKDAAEPEAGKPAP